MNRTDKAVACFKQGFSCSQAIVSTFAEGTGLERETALKVAAGFGGGMARMGLTCGAVTGAIIVLGLKHGATSAEDLQAKQKTYQLVRDFTAKFKARHGSIVCKELLGGIDLSTQEGMEQAKRTDVINTLCPKFVQHAAEILEEIL